MQKVPKRWLGSILAQLTLLHFFLEILSFLFVWRKHTHRLDCQLKRTASKLGTLQILKWLLSTKAAVEQKSLESQKTFHSMLTLGMDIWAPSIHDRNLHPDFIIHTTRNKVKKGKSWRQIKKQWIWLDRKKSWIRRSKNLCRVIKCRLSRNCLDLIDSSFYFVIKLDLTSQLFSSFEPSWVKAVAREPCPSLSALRARGLTVIYLFAF